MKRVSEPQLMLAIILFVVFAFLMQGRAHGEYVYFTYGSKAGKGNYVVAREQSKQGIWTPDKEQARDLAYALNWAHEKRTKPCEYVKDGSGWMVPSGPCEFVDQKEATTK